MTNEEAAALMDVNPDGTEKPAAPPAPPEDPPRIRYEVPPWVQGVPHIFPAAIQANRTLAAAAKERFNKHGGYNFRGIEDVYNAVHSALADAGVITVPVTLKREERETRSKSDGTNHWVRMLMEYWCYADDGSALVIGPIYGEAFDSGDKAGNKAISYAQKYALIQTFTLPTKEAAEGDYDDNTADKGEPIGPDTAAKVLAQFATIGITSDQLQRKLGCSVADASVNLLPQLKAWGEEISRNKGAALRIFGPPDTAAAGQRAADVSQRLNGGAK